MLLLDQPRLRATHPEHLRARVHVAIDLASAVVCLVLFNASSFLQSGATRGRTNLTQSVGRTIRRTYRKPHFVDLVWHDRSHVRHHWSRSNAQTVAAQST